MLASSKRLSQAMRRAVSCACIGHVAQHAIVKQVATKHKQIVLRTFWSASARVSAMAMPSASVSARFGGADFARLAGGALAGVFSPERGWHSINSEVAFAALLYGFATMCSATVGGATMLNTTREKSAGGAGCPIAAGRLASDWQIAAGAHPACACQRASPMPGRPPPPPHSSPPPARPSLPTSSPALSRPPWAPLPLPRRRRRRHATQGAPAPPRPPRALPPLPLCPPPLRQTTATSPPRPLHRRGGRCASRPSPPAAPPAAPSTAPAAPRAAGAPLRIVCVTST